MWRNADQAVAGVSRIGVSAQARFATAICSRAPSNAFHAFFTLVIRAIGQRPWRLHQSIGEDELGGMQIE